MSHLQHGKQQPCPTVVPYLSATPARLSLLRTWCTRTSRSSPGTLASSRPLPFPLTKLSLLFPRRLSPLESSPPSLPPPVERDVSRRRDGRVMSCSGDGAREDGSGLNTDRSGRNRDEEEDARWFIGASRDGGREDKVRWSELESEQRRRRGMPASALPALPREVVVSLSALDPSDPAPALLEDCLDELFPDGENICL
jgi:hypothetical protein